MYEITTTTQQLRNVYTCEEFAKEVLCEKRTANWVRNQCHAKRIKTVGGKPYMIPQSEALRFIAPELKRAS